MRRTPKSLSQTEQLSFISLLSPQSHSHSRTGWRQPFTKQIELFISNNLKITIHRLAEWRESTVGMTEGFL